MFTIFARLADYVTYTLLGFDKASAFGDAIHFFIEDTTKIFFLILIMIYLIGILRASMNMDRIRNFLKGKPRWLGYTLASMSGAVTPFCSCSSIPMFLGFTSVGIPTGFTLAFLITSPLINEVAVVLLGTLLGWKFTLIYIFSGLFIGTAGGFVFDFLKAERHLQPLALNMKGSISGTQSQEFSRPSFKERHLFAKNEVFDILSRIWIWIFIGVGVGSAIHGLVPERWIASNLGDGSWWSVPSAVALGIPLYSNASGMVPIIETLLEKGLPIGTALALMMSTVGASFPEFILLKEVIKPKLLMWLLCYFLVSFTVIGWVFNLIF